ncbi:uncharacterized protein LOC118149139 [Callithrix jacchus]
MLTPPEPLARLGRFPRYCPHGDPRPAGRRPGEPLPCCLGLGSAGEAGRSHRQAAPFPGLAPLPAVFSSARLRTQFRPGLGCSRGRCSPLRPWGSLRFESKRYYAKDGEGDGKQKERFKVLEEAPHSLPQWLN